ncbi:GAF domain-containing protein [Sphingomonas sp. G-3-2-10]|jgi:hypothetical protein|uniref:GAF domain-containing protein n=1 Tax=Sphingomonas sp. G-3-2-10 TaxID=2728838 RepID=UPI00146BBE8D|nr:GAF domain-containing protein [Sphingomonas sp. G-3-2-10]NML04708.1 GAF domain-containing protein [Sphingomonas sp. G-3-2-10]
MEVASLERRRRLMDTLGQLAQVDTIEALVMTLRGSARAIGNADGITVVRRIGNRVAYVAEDAASPLWTGQDFPIEACISGLAMIENRPIVIPDIFADDRVPHEAYRATFAKSMAMFPIGVAEPRMSMGAYWAKTGEIDPEAVALLSNLARAASRVFDRVEGSRMGAAG